LGVGSISHGHYLVCGNGRRIWRKREREKRERERREREREKA
jgi:hypothetical protein